MKDNDSGRPPDGDGLSQAEPVSAVSALRASIPSAGDVFTIPYPFVRETYSGFDGDGYSDMPTWRPGVNYVWVSQDHSAPVADALGEASFTVVATFKPGRFPTRVFYTRQFVNPDGRRFGKPKLHISTLDKFRRLARGYQHPFGVGQPLPSASQWWRKDESEREFMALLAEYASGIAARSDETPQAAQPEGQEPGPKGTPKHLSTGDDNV